jgi:hypothetical protein
MRASYCNKYDADDQRSGSLAHSLKRRRPPFPVRADGRETLLTNETESFSTNETEVFT